MAYRISEIELDHMFDGVGPRGQFRVVYRRADYLTDMLGTVPFLLRSGVSFEK